MSKPVIMNGVFAVFLLWSCEHNPIAPPGEIGPIIFTSKSGNYGQIYSINEDGSGLLKLTRSPFNNFWARWSPDGEWIVFNSLNRTPNRHFYSIVISNKHGRNERLILEHGYGPVFSPEGDRIAFRFDTESPGLGARRDIAIYDLKQKVGTFVLPNSSDYFVADWSPDGRYLLVTAREDLTQLESKICLIDLYDSTRIEIVTGGEFYIGRFSPDGKSITYVHRIRPSEVSFRDILNIIEVSGLNRRTIITLENTVITSPVWSPDGSKIAFWTWNTVATEENEKIYLIHVDGTDVEVIFTPRETIGFASLDWRW
jgi:Tol biopolymer transport system component